VINNAPNPEQRRRWVSTSASVPRVITERW
jgi:hypothetical protein